MPGTFREIQENWSDLEPREKEFFEPANHAKHAKGKEKLKKGKKWIL